MNSLPGEPDALKGAFAVRRGAVGNVPKGNALAAYSTDEDGTASKRDIRHRLLAETRQDIQQMT